MFVLIRNVQEEQETQLRVNHDIFLRPTPWKVSFQADWSMLCRKRAFSYVFLPEEYSEVSFQFLLDESVLKVLDREGVTVWYTPLIPMNLLTWVLFHVESIIGGTLWRVWEYRWAAGVVTRKEMQKQIEVLTKQVQELQQEREDRNYESACERVTARQ